MLRLTILALSALALIACESKIPAPKYRTYDAAVVADSAPTLIKHRKKRPKRRRAQRPHRRKVPHQATYTPPPPVMPPPPPEGTPQRPEDMAKLSKAAADGQPIDKPGAPPIKRLDAYRMQVGKVFVDRLNRKVELPARVNMTEGILEYVAVSTNGKLHEAIIEVLAEPSHLHLGLVLIGLDPERRAPDAPDGTLGALLSKGGQMTLSATWKDPKTGEARQVPINEWMYSRKIKGAAKPLVFGFSGSGFWEGRYRADLERSIFGLVPDGSVVASLASDAGNPFHGDALGYEVYTKVIPPKGTPMKLVVEAVGPKPPHPHAAPAEGTPLAP